MYLIRTPRVIQSLFPNFLWRISTDEKRLYLTFDDGPIPEVTPWVLDQLAAYNAKATFFCVGENVQRYPRIFQRTVREGHTVGNHTFNHLSGWANENVPYFHNVRTCAHLVNSNLFRPPYGRLKPKQVQFLQRHYRIVMWDVLSGDFDSEVSRDQCYHNVVDNVRPGSIVVFHDSLKARDKMQYALPRTLQHFSEQGFTFEPLKAIALRGKFSLMQTA